jgi:two-component system KDP operon response regulator KdpE
MISDREGPRLQGAQSILRGEGRVLLVEDDPRIQRLLETQLAARGWEVSVTSSAAVALQKVADETPDLVLLDIGLPDGDGLTVCRKIREWSSVPILLVTAADTPQVKVAALEMGADDYLTKPFHTGELIARMRAVLRRVRAASPEMAPSRAEIGPFQIHFAQREVWRSGELVHLTKIEFDLLRELVLHLDRVLTYTHLLSAVWGAGYEDVRVVHVHVSHLRRKLEPAVTGTRYLLTVPGVGYRFRSAEGTETAE